jgi:hypothetical protein
VIKRQFFAWFDPDKREYRVSLVAPDSPVRPSIIFEERADLEEYVERKRGRLMWWPPLPLGA